jgi:membrane protein
MYQNSVKQIFIIYYLFLKDFITAVIDRKLGYYSASLSFYTILSIIPLLIIIFYLSSLVPIFKEVSLIIKESVLSHFLPTNSKAFLAQIDTFLSQSNSKIGIFGFFYVLIASTVFFRNYDSIVNEIFETPKRDFVRAIEVYWILLVAVTAMIPLSFYLSNIIQHIINRNLDNESVRIFYFLPYLIIWSLFFIAYKVSVNKRVSTQAAFISSFISSGIWYLAKSLLLVYLFHNPAYWNIYGSLTMLLLMMFWLYLSWAIFLRGLKLCAVLDKHKENTTKLSQL